MENSDFNTVHELVKVMKNFEERLVKNEQLVLHTFSYLYNRCDDNQLDYSYIQKDISELYDTCAFLKESIKGIQINQPNKTLYIKTENPTIIKKKRPWHYFISKHFRYRTLLKQKAQLEEQIRLNNEEKRRLKELEEKRIREEQEKRKLEMERRIAEQKQKDEKLKQERRRKAKNEMNRILSGLKQ